MKQRPTSTPTWIYAFGVIILAFGLWLIVPDRSICRPNQTVDELASRCEITYQGQSGQTALALLQATHQVETQSFSFGDMVTSIDGVKAPSTHFWAFYINGEQAQTGAGDYHTFATDTITWKLEKIQLTQ